MTATATPTTNAADPSTTTANNNIVVARATPDDFAAIADIAAAAFATDRQTRLKALGRAGYDMRKGTLESLPSLLRSPRCLVLKAVERSSSDHENNNNNNNTTTEILGYCVWGFHAVQDPLNHPAVAPLLPAFLDPERDPTRVAAFLANPTPPPPSNVDDRYTTTNTPDPLPEDGPQKLAALVSADLDAWCAAAMPPATNNPPPSMYVVSLSVHPLHHRRGVAARLLRAGTRIADALGAWAWVHAPPAAVAAYRSAGFVETVRRLEIDLDRYAPDGWARPPPDVVGAVGEEDARSADRWGTYVFEYLKRGPA
ncbi:hypothetical protein DFJ73DRAFT_786443 [Zopfochytrium polystomum]|nr:hypothetical protein DFJ73DRAFT_786443 [Zopfochytrium polystomum]